MYNIASYIDHTILKPVTTHMEVKKICDEALQYGFAAVCIPPPLVHNAKEWVSAGQSPAPEMGASGSVLATLERSNTPSARKGPLVKVATVIGFPFGYSVALAKEKEAEQALADGADELDMVINLVALKNGDWSILESEIRPVTELAHGKGKIVKVIIESGVLSDEEIIRCCALYSGVGVDFLKTSTGYAEKGATVEAVRLMRRHLPSAVRIKASGGIRTNAFARELIEAGASRLGCSASVAIVTAKPAGEAAGY